VLSSRLEGGANALSEAVVAGTPVLASRIAGNVGLLGKDYPGYFKTGDTRGLARLLWRAESEADFLQVLRRRVNDLATNFAPERELAAWANLLSEVFAGRR
jgi:glycosyltransferase involved in cell wall biosynthesis